MGLLEKAAADLAGILSDSVGGFALPIQIVDPNGNTATVNGLAADIGTAINPDTGQIVAGRTVSVALPLRGLAAAGLGQPVGIAAGASRRPWTCSFTLPTGDEQTFRVARTKPDRLGCLVCDLELYER